MNLMTNLEGKVSWQKIVAVYARPDLPRNLWQIINTLIPYFALFYTSMRSDEANRRLAGWDVLKRYRRGTA